MVIAQIENGID